MTIIDEVRKEREDLARVLKKHIGIRKIVEDLYPDNAHFIYELLQNAEDKGATEVEFILKKSSLAFEHNGLPFDSHDIYAITDIGEGTKIHDDDKIGRFGVGFKAVFVYTETPHIWSPTFSFEIRDLVLPSPLDCRAEFGDRTHFDFPFDNPKKSDKDAFSEVEVGLSQLAETTLLFLTHLKSIRWQNCQAPAGEVLKIPHSDIHYEMVKKLDGKIISTSHFLMMSELVHGLKNHRVGVAFPLDFQPKNQEFDPNKSLSKQLKIIPANPGRVSVFFPAEKEISGLRFHLHAPFVPELSRASIKETPANKPLFDQLTSLVARSLHQIRDLGMLTLEFLSVLPNSQDSIPARYECIRSAIIREMNAKPLTPTHAKSHAPAIHLLQARASLKELLSDEDIQFLIGSENEPKQWGISAAQRNSNADRFLASLEITEWDTERFIELLSERAGEGNDDNEFYAWLCRKSIEWHQRLYAFLKAELGPEDDLWRCEDLKLVRLSDGNYSRGSKCFFPSEGFEYDDVLPRINAGIYSSGKSKNQKENARSFLLAIGVSEVGEAEQAEVILKNRYTYEAKIPNEKTYRKDLKRFVALLEKEPGKASLFAEHYIFLGDDGDWHTPNDIFLDQPFRQTGLSHFHKALGEDAKRVALNESYQNRGIAVERLAKFAEAVGAHTQLEITETTCYANPQWSYLRSVSGERFTSPINCDYKIEGLDNLLETPSIELSKLIWTTMCSVAHKSLRAVYRKSEAWGALHADSQLVHHLKEAAWIPQINGSFVPPTEASSEYLPQGFPFDPGFHWLKAVGFGINIVKRSEAELKRQESAQELGFEDNDCLDRARRFIGFPVQVQERILAELESRQAIELPEHVPVNPARRAERVGDNAANAPDRDTEGRMRAVSIGLEEVKKEAGQYLREQYTNSDQEMICQICKAQLPFKLDDGSDYFEKVEFLPNLKGRHYQNYLSLCPNHAAMFRYANGSADITIEMLMALAGNELEIILAQNDNTIYFTKTHLADLKAIIGAEEESPNVGADAGKASS